MEMVEYSDDLFQFITNMFKPANVTAIKESEVPGTIDIIVNQKGDLGLAIGRVSPSRRRESPAGGSGGRISVNPRGGGVR